MQVLTIFTCPYHNVLPEAICYYLQCNFVVILMLMNKVGVQSLNFIRASMLVMSLS